MGRILTGWTERHLLGYGSEWMAEWFTSKIQDGRHKHVYLQGVVFETGVSWEREEKTFMEKDEVEDMSSSAYWPQNFAKKAIAHYRNTTRKFKRTNAMEDFFIPKNQPITYSNRNLTIIIHGVGQLPEDFQGLFWGALGFHSLHQLVSNHSARKAAGSFVLILVMWTRFDGQEWFELIRQDIHNPLVVWKPHDL